MSTLTASASESAMGATTAGSDQLGEGRGRGAPEVASGARRCPGEGGLLQVLGSFLTVTTSAGRGVEAVGAGHGSAGHRTPPADAFTGRASRTGVLAALGGQSHGSRAGSPGPSL